MLPVFIYHIPFLSLSFPPCLPFLPSYLYSSPLNHIYLLSLPFPLYTSNTRFSLSCTCSTLRFFFSTLPCTSPLFLFFSSNTVLTSGSSPLISSVPASPFSCPVAFLLLSPFLPSFLASLLPSFNFYSLVSITGPSAPRITHSSFPPCPPCHHFFLVPSICYTRFPVPLFPLFHFQYLCFFSVGYCFLPGWYDPCI